MLIIDRSPRKYASEIMCLGWKDDKSKASGAFALSASQTALFARAGGRDVHQIVLERNSHWEYEPQQRIRTMAARPAHRLSFFWVKRAFAIENARIKSKLIHAGES